MTILNEFKNISGKIRKFFFANSEEDINREPILSKEETIQLAYEKLNVYLEENNTLKIEETLYDIKYNPQRPPLQIYSNPPLTASEKKDISFNTVNKILDHCIKLNNKDLLSKIVKYINLQENYDNIVKPLLEKKDFLTLLIMSESSVSLRDDFLINLFELRKQLLKEDKYQEIIENFNLVKESIDVRKEYYILHKFSNQQTNKEYENHYKELDNMNNLLLILTYNACIKNYDSVKLNEMIKEDPYFNEKVEDLIQIAIKLDNSKALEILIINTKLENDKKFYYENDILLPKTLFNIANENEAINCMKFAIEYNNEPFSSIHLKSALYNATQKNKSESIKYLIMTFSKDYDDEFLNELENANENTATLIKTIRLNINKMVPKSVLLDKINGLKNNLSTNTPEIKNTM